MSPPDTVHLFISLRSLHILAAALWVGAASFISLILLPALGRGAPEMIARLVRARLPIFMAGTAATTVLSGLFLYWYVYSAGGFGNHAAWTFAIAGALGLTAAIVGRGVVGRSAVRIAKLFEQGSNQPGGPQDRATAEAITVLQKRMQVAGKVHLALMVAALLLMSMGHYL